MGQTIPKKDIYTTLQSTGLPCAYSHFRKDEIEDIPEPPYLVYIGTGQYHLAGSNGYVYKRNTYEVGYYFKSKNPTTEALIESTLEGDGYLYEKSEDMYIEEMDCFVIYYDC